MTRRSTTAPLESVRERILQAAILEFGVAGFHLTSMRAIAERSGSNKPMIYYHFQGKEGVYLAAIRLLLEETAARLREATDDGADALDRLRRFTEVYLDAFLISRPMMERVLRELESLPHDLYNAIVEDYNRLIGIQIRRILADGVESGMFRRIDIDGCVSGLISLLHGFVRGRRMPADRAQRLAQSQIMDYYALGLLAPEHLARRSRPFALEC